MPYYMPNRMTHGAVLLLFPSCISEIFLQWKSFHMHKTSACAICTRTYAHYPVAIKQGMATRTLENVSEISYTLEAHFIQVKSGSVRDADFVEFLQSLLPGSGYYLYEGIIPEVAAGITFEARNLSRWMHPLCRVDHQQGVTDVLCRKIFAQS